MLRGALWVFACGALFGFLVLVFLSVSAVWLVVLLVFFVFLLRLFD
jgi:hypothetical protein